MRRAITIFALTTAVLAFIIGSGAWIVGQWYSVGGRLGRIRYSTSYGAKTMEKDTDQTPGPRLTATEEYWKQPLWYDELPRPMFNTSPYFPGLWEMVLPYWLILAFSLATGGFGFWLARKRPHRQAFEVLGPPDEAPAVGSSGPLPAAQRQRIK